MRGVLVTFVFVLGVLIGFSYASFTKESKQELKNYSVAANTEFVYGYDQQTDTEYNQYENDISSAITLPDFLVSEFALRNINVDSITKREWQYFKKTISIVAIADFIIKTNRTVLETFIEGDDFDNVAGLVEQGAPLNHHYVFDRTPLIFAAKFGSYQMFQYLIGLGAEVPLVTDVNGNNILHYARENQSDEDREQIIAYLTRLNVDDTSARSKLFQALIAGKKGERVTELINQLDVNVELSKGINILEHSVRSGISAEQLALFDEQLISVLATGDGYNPLHAAGINTAVTKEVLVRLIEAGADINGVDAAGMTPIMYTALVGNYAAAELLVAYGADVEYVSPSGGSVLGLLPDDTDSQTRWQYQQLLNQ